MVHIRPLRVRARLRTVLIAAPFLISRVALTSFAGAQDLPGGVATDLFEQALQEEISVPVVEERGSASIPTVFAWIIGLVTAALVTRRLRDEFVRFAGREGPEIHPVPGAVQAAAPDVEDATAVASRPRKPSKPPEVLKLPPHVVAIRERSAAARAVLRPESLGEARPRRQLDVTVPRYDPSRSEDGARPSGTVHMSRTAANPAVAAPKANGAAAPKPPHGPTPCHSTPPSRDAGRLMRPTSAA